MAAAQRFLFHGAEEVDPQVQADLANVNGFNADQLQQILALVLDLLADPPGSNFQQRLAAFADEHKVNVPALRNVSRGLILLCRGATKQNLLPAQVHEDCINLGLSEEAAAAIRACWEERGGALATAQVTKTIMANQLVDLEWKFGVTAASSEVNQVGVTFLQMKLTIDRGNGQREDVHMELSLQQFYQFMADMEKAKTFLDFLSPS